MTTTNKLTGNYIISTCNELDGGMVHVQYRYECGHCLPWLDVSTATFVLAKHGEAAVYAFDTFDDPDYVDSDGEQIICKITILLSGKCFECRHKADRTYCDELPRPQGFEAVTLYHGIAAYNTGHLHSVSDYYSRIIEVVRNQHWQICCSTKPIGHIGIVVEGEVLCASNADLYSLIDKNTCRRYFDKERYRAQHLIYDAKDLDDSIWSHDEVITRGSKPTAVWVYSGADNTIKKYGMYIARLLKIDCVTVDKIVHAN